LDETRGMIVPTGACQLKRRTARAGKSAQAVPHAA
jgi:hypothetical protein